jgi:hypothetical protein
MRPLLVLLFGLVLGCSQAQAADRRLLLSLVPPRLAAGEYIGDFRIEVDGATILSACHIPFGWQVTTGMYDSNSGILAGAGGLGGSLVSPDSHNLDQLRDLFLIQLNPGEGSPRFSGSVTIGHYGANDRRGRKVRVSPRLLRTIPGTQCPDARP